MEESWAHLLFQQPQQRLVRGRADPVSCLADLLRSGIWGLQLCPETPPPQTSPSPRLDGFLLPLAPWHQLESSEHRRSSLPGARCPMPDAQALQVELSLSPAVGAAGAVTLRRQGTPSPATCRSNLTERPEKPNSSQMFSWTRTNCSFLEAHALGSVWALFQRKRGSRIPCTRLEPGPALSPCCKAPAALGLQSAPRSRLTNWAKQRTGRSCHLREEPGHFGKL